MVIVFASRRWNLKGWVKKYVVRKKGCKEDVNTRASAVESYLCSWTGEGLATGLGLQNILAKLAGYRASHRCGGGETSVAVLCGVYFTGQARHLLTTAGQVEALLSGFEN